jgi:hypothetical protein
MWLVKNYNDVFMVNPSGQRDPNLVPPLERNGLADFYGNNVIIHYNCSTRAQSYLNIWARSHNGNKPS